jgi:putative transposase
MVNSTDTLSIAKQCDLMNLARSTYYYQPIPESELNLRIMKMIDHKYLERPFYGSRPITIFLKRCGEIVNRKRVQRLMRKMGLEAQYPKPRTSIGNKDHDKYPYLLNGVKIVRPNQVWGVDITYIPIETGYLYLVAILDLCSRYVLASGLSNNLESGFCIESLQTALRTGLKPEIMNSDQGVQFTSKAWTDVLKQHSIAISMSGKGRCWDNIFVERLWRTVKYEEVYLKNYITGQEAEKELDLYFDFYNNERVHQKLAYNTPRAIHFGEKVLA